MEEFPSNSNKSKEPKPEKDIQKVVTGEVIEKKKSFGSKVRAVFIGGELKSAGAYVATEVLFPALRNLIVDAAESGIRRMVYGDTAPRRSGTSLGSGRSRIAYNSPIDRYGSQSRGMLPGQAARVPPRAQDVMDVVMVSREEAELVILEMADIIQQWEVASLTDFKKLCGFPATYVDDNWGWTNINFFDIKQTRDGWRIHLPNPEPI